MSKDTILCTQKKDGEERGKLSTKSDYKIRECSLLQTIETLAIS